MIVGFSWFSAIRVDDRERQGASRRLSSGFVQHRRLAPCRSHVTSFNTDSLYEQRRGSRFIRPSN